MLNVIVTWYAALSWLPTQAQCIKKSIKDYYKDSIPPLKRSLFSNYCCCDFKGSEQTVTQHFGPRTHEVASDNPGRACYESELHTDTCVFVSVNESYMCIFPPLGWKIEQQSTWDSSDSNGSHLCWLEWLFYAMLRPVSRFKSKKKNRSVSYFDKITKFLHISCKVSKSFKWLNNL